MPDDGRYYARRVEDELTLAAGATGRAVKAVHLDTVARYATLCERSSPAPHGRDHRSGDRRWFRDRVRRQRFLRDKRAPERRSCRRVIADQAGRRGSYETILPSDGVTRMSPRGDMRVTLNKTDITVVGRHIRPQGRRSRPVDR